MTKSHSWIDTRALRSFLRAPGRTLTTAARTTLTAVLRALKSCATA